MGMSNMWRWTDTDKPQKFPETPWALPLTMKDFPYPNKKAEWFWEGGFNRNPITDLEKAIDRELHRLIEQGVEPDEVRRAVQRMQAAAIYARDSLAGPANIVGAALATGRTVEDVAAWPERIGAVTPADIQAAARAVLVERNSATGILLPERTS